MSASISRRERGNNVLDLARRDIIDEELRLKGAAPSAPASGSISGASDVVLTGLADGHVLEWDTATSKWINVPPAAAGSGIVRVVQTQAVSFSAGAAAATDYVYHVTGTTTATLPTAVGNTNRYTIKNAGVATVSLASTAAQTFDGTASPIALSPGQALDLVSDGANWSIL